jgi:peptidoglycan hydrolase CwlO-like protein
MPRLDALDDEFSVDAAPKGNRLLMLGIMALGLGVIGAVVFAWSNADGPLRFELQSAATAPKSTQLAAAQEEIERLRGELDALKNELTETRNELTETQHQAAHTIAAMKATEKDLRRHLPPPYWYSDPATLKLATPPRRR